MANVFATKTGNWSDTTVWNTGALPTSADDVYANGFTVTINQNISVLSIRTQSASGINAGGGFSLPNPFDITANIIAGTTACLAISTTTGTVNIVGDATGGTTINSYALNISSSSIVNHTGNLFGSSGQNSFGCLISGATTYNLTGNSTGGIGSNSHGISNTGVGNISITGNVIGGITGFGCNNATTGSINITGSCVAGTVVGATNVSTGTINANTAIATTGASTSVSGINGVSINGTTTVKSAIWGSSGQNPLSGFVRFQNVSDITVNVPRIGSTAVTLQDLNNAANVVPITSNVRSGVSYNSGNNVGTLIVPLPSDVRKSVPTDNTVGTAELSASDFWGALLSNNNVTGSFGKLIKDNIDATISSRLASSDYSSSSAPTVQQIRTEMDTNSTKLANLDATVSSRLATSGYTAPPTVSQIRSEIDTNSTKLDVTVGSRLAASTYVTPPTAVQVRTEMDTNSTKLANLDATISSRASASNLASIPTNPLLTNDTRLNNIDAAISSRLAASAYTTPPTVNSVSQGVWQYATRGLTESPDVPTAQEISNQVWLDTPVRLENVATADIVAEQLSANLP